MSQHPRDEEEGTGTSDDTDQPCFVLHLIPFGVSVPIEGQYCLVSTGQGAFMSFPGGWAIGGAAATGTHEEKPSALAEWNHPQGYHLVPGTPL